MNMVIFGVTEEQYEIIAHVMLYTRNAKHTAKLAQDLAEEYDIEGEFVVIDEVDI